MYEAGNIMMNNEQVMDGVYELLNSVQVEATFPDGTKLITIYIILSKKNKKNSNLIPEQYDLLKE